MALPGGAFDDGWSGASVTAASLHVQRPALTERRYMKRPALTERRYMKRPALTERRYMK
jgi:hypothetical protein